MTDPIRDAMALVGALVPPGQELTWRTPLEADESKWFIAAASAGIVEFRTCGPECFRFKKWGVAGPDHFDTPDGRPRHLFSKPVGEVAWLNREYIPHLAAYGRAILGCGYSKAHSSFSRYRVFGRDLLRKRAGQGYETDAEFYDADGGVFFHVEAKRDRKATEAVVASIEKVRRFSGLPDRVAKELEYVLDLAPKYLWIVGPGSVDPASHVYSVTVTGLEARFEPVHGIPSPPTAVRAHEG